MAESKLMVHAIQDVTIVNFRDSTMLDSAAIEAVGRELYALVDEKAVRKIVLDFTTVKFLASQAVGLLITLKKKADAINGQFVICGMREEIKRAFKIMNLMKMFKFCDDEQQALGVFDVFTA